MCRLSGFTSPGGGTVNTGAYTSRSSTPQVWPPSPAQFTADPGQRRTQFTSDEWVFWGGGLVLLIVNYLLYRHGKVVAQLFHRFRDNKNTFCRTRYLSHCRTLLSTS